jgi:hypothetical protein
MRITEETSAINRMLQSHGLGRLEDGAGLVAQLGYMVMDIYLSRTVNLRGRRWHPGPLADLG